jgi:hypothetical protein
MTPEQHALHIKREANMRRIEQDRRIRSRREINLAGVARARAVLDQARRGVWRG